jgi:orotate phosphoribosyltransferase-like protein
VALQSAIKTLSDNGMSQTAIGHKLSIAPQTVKQLILQAKQTLEDESVGVLQDWRTAASVGASKGRHEPARDWLLHAGVVAPLADSKPQGPQVIIGIASLPGLPGWGESRSDPDSLSPISVQVIDSKGQA